MEWTCVHEWKCTPKSLLLSPLSVGTYGVTIVVAVRNSLGLHNAARPLLAHLEPQFVRVVLGNQVVGGGGGNLQEPAAHA